MFAMDPLHFAGLLLTLGYIACFSNFLFAFNVLRNVFHFLYFTVSLLLWIFYSGCETLCFKFETTFVLRKKVLHKIKCFWVKVFQK